MRNALINLNNNTLATLLRSLDLYHDALAKTVGNYCYELNTQPKETTQLVRDSPDFKELLKEVGRVNLLKKQIAYQTRLSKKTRGE